MIKVKSKKKFRDINLFMKNFMIFLCFFLTVVNLYSQNKIALIVGISKYPKNSDWSFINGSNDIKLLNPVLKNKSFETIILEDEQATKKNIIKELSEIEHKAIKGDIVLIHFSTHGQQVIDKNFDETDKLDEAIIPYDAKKYYCKNKYEGENHLRDDELNVLLNYIRVKIGDKGVLIVTADACHSATITRGEQENDNPIRGTSIIFGSTRFIPSQNGRIKKSEKNVYLPIEKNKSNYTIISACQEYQQNFEIKVDNKFYGVLSYSIFQVLNNSINFNPITFHKEISSTLKRYTRNQTPKIETTYRN